MVLTDLCMAPDTRAPDPGLCAPKKATPLPWPPFTPRRCRGHLFPRRLRPLPARPHCATSGRKRRQITILARDLADAQAAARNAETTIPFWADYARRAGVEGTTQQAASHGARCARYRGLPKTRLDHLYMACALNLLRLEAFAATTDIPAILRRFASRLVGEAVWSSTHPSLGWKTSIAQHTYEDFRVQYLYEN